MSEVDALIAKIRASEQREADAKEQRFQEEQQRERRSRCAICGRKYLWGQAVMNRATPPVWIAGIYAHPICVERKQEGRPR